MKQFKTMITRDYVPDWSTADGLREVIVNALDSNNPLEYEVIHDGLSVTSVGITLPSSVLAMGYSKHRDDLSAVGRHGEGLLISMIPILRDGGSIAIYNGGVKWVPRFEYDENLELDILVIDEEPLPAPTNNYTVEVSCEGSYVDEATSKCLYMQEDIGEVYECRMGRVLKDTKYSGKLYVGGYFVCDIPSHSFGYDFSPEYLHLNRDRKNVDNWDLNINTSKIIAEAMPEEEVVDLIYNTSRDLSYMNYTGSHSPYSDKVYDRFKEDRGEDTFVACDYDEAETLEQRGAKNVEVVYDSLKYKAITESSEYQEKLESLEEPEEKDTRSPLEMLEEWYKEHEVEFQVAPECFEDLEELVNLFEKRGVSWDD